MQHSLGIHLTFCSFVTGQSVMSLIRKRSGISRALEAAHGL
jgi:hypothetical protein